jgi:hypothetical protein
MFFGAIGMRDRNEEIEAQKAKMSGAIEKKACEEQGETDRGGVQGAHLNPLDHFLNPMGLFLRTSIPIIWRILSAFLVLTRLNPWLRGPVSPR